MATTNDEAPVGEGDSSGFFRLIEPLMAPMARRSINKDYRKLKELLEAG